MTTLDLPSELATMLAILRAELGATNELFVDETYLRDLEKLLGATIPREVVALYVAAGLPLGELHELTEQIGVFYVSQERPRWRTDFRFDHVAFGFVGDWPRYYACFARKTGAIGVWNVKSESLETHGFPRTVAEYCRWRWDEIDFERAKSGEPVRIAVGVKEVPVDKVRHAKFGIGVVKNRIDDKVVVDFGEHGTKTLAAKFVEKV